ncbi:HSP20-like chaperone [Haematococcus lacustris]
MFGFPPMPAMRPMPGMPPFPEMPAMPPMPTMPDIPRQPDLVEHPDRYTVEASAPEFSPEDVHVELGEDNTLMVSGSKVVNTGKQSSASSFSRSFALPGNIRADGIRAHLDLGVLTVDM